MINIYLDFNPSPNRTMKWNHETNIWIWEFMNEINTYQSEQNEWMNEWSYTNKTIYDALNRTRTLATQEGQKIHFYSESFWMFFLKTILKEC